MAAGERRECEMSEYVRGLDEKTRSRYLEKVKLCDDNDPFCLLKKDLSSDLSKYPAVEFPDICNYLVLQTSFYTAREMKAWKSMEAYNFFVCGWVKEIGVKELQNKSCIVFARVNHSQRSSVTPLKTWLLVKQDGEVITAHCNCMAGLAESCSHVGAVLYALETGVKMRESVTCTMERSKWLMPSHVNKIPVAPVAEIDFSSAKAKKQKLDLAISGSEINQQKVPLKSCPRVAPGSPTYIKFFEELNKSCPRSASLMLKQQHHQKFIPKSATTILPKSIMDFRTEETLELSPESLEKYCKDFQLPDLTPAQIKIVERETRKQAGSRIWFRQRAGKITASKLKQATHTNVENPAKSLIKAICYPEVYRFSTSATSYGCKHEVMARRDYEAAMKAQHDGFSVADSGLCLNMKWPYMGATPDGVIVCNCHGTGLCEIKCPYCYKEKENLAACAGKKGFCLVKDVDDSVKLDRSHSYYYQVQAQLHITQVEYCDFIVWNKCDLFIERILPDQEFWDKIQPKAEKFFKKCILPEVLGKKFTKHVAKSILSSTSSSHRSA